MTDKLECEKPKKIDKLLSLILRKQPKPDYQENQLNKTGETKMTDKEEYREAEEKAIRQIEMSELPEDVKEEWKGLM